MSFELLSEKIAQKRNPTVVGLDTKLDHLPSDFFDVEQETLEAAAAAVLAFNTGLIDALYDIVPAVKIQAAFYEALGPAGLETMRETMIRAAGAGLYVIADAKRGDIGSTAEAYADAWLGETLVGKTLLRPFPADSLTMNAYLGTDGVTPFLKRCRQYARTIFVLAKTSNPSSGEFQDRNADGAPLYRRVAEKAAEWGTDCVGIVAGATYPTQLCELRSALPHTFFLIPGYGAQGGGAENVAPGFDERGGGAVVNSSRGIACAWRTTGRPYQDAARAEAIRMRGELQAIVERGR